MTRDASPALESRGPLDGGQRESQLNSMASILPLYLYVVLPVATAVFLIHACSKYGLAGYLVAATPFLAFSIAYAMLRRNVLTSGYSGFRSIALLEAFLSIALICAQPTRSKWVQAAQILASFLAANFWLLRASWVA